MKIKEKTIIVKKVSAYNSPGHYAIVALNESEENILKCIIRYKCFKDEGEPSKCIVMKLDDKGICHDCGREAEYGIIWIDEKTGKLSQLGLLCGICEVGG